MLMKVNKIILLVQLIDHIHEGNVTLISFSFFVKDSNQNLNRASGVQDRNQDLKGTLLKFEKKLSYLEFDDVFQGLLRFYSLYLEILTMIFSPDPDPNKQTVL